MRRRGHRLAGALLVVAVLWPLTSCEQQVRGQVLYAGDVTAVDASPWVQERVTLGTTGLLVSVNSVDEAGVAATDYWVERLPALSDATGGFDAVVLSLGVTDLMAGESPSDLAERVDAIAGAASSVASRGVYWATLDETIPGYEEEATALNDALARAAAAHPALHLLDFGAELASHPSYREDEGLRWTTEGEQAFAELVDAELVALLDPPVPGVSLVKSADEAACVVHQLTVKGVPTTSYEASSTTAKTTVTASAARLVFAAAGGEQAKVVVTNTFPGRCPAGQLYC